MSEKPNVIHVNWDPGSSDENQPHVCMLTLDGNAHVIPVEVFTKIISGEMPVSDMDDWEIITRTIVSEWFFNLEDRS